MKKILISTFCLLAFWSVAISQSLGNDILFKLTVSGSNLVVANAQNSPITTVPLITIGQTIEVSPIFFQISFGRDEAGNLEVIVSSDSKHPSHLSFDIIGRRIDMDADSMVVATFSKDLKQITFEPGAREGVKLDGKPLASSSTLITTPPTLPSNINSKEMMDTSAPLASSEIAVYDSPPESSTIALASEFKSRNPNTLLVPLDPAIPLTPQRIAQMKDAKQIALKRVFWAEPITSPEEVQAFASVVPSNEVKLAEIKGDVTVVLSQGKSVVAKNGMALDPASKLVAGDNSSVAVMIAGIDSIRLTPNTSAMVELNPVNNNKTILVTLKEGAIFNKVGFSELNGQDFKVKTPNGFAVSHGTDFSTSFYAGRTTVISVQGAVEVLDSMGNYLGTVAPRVEHSVGYLTFGLNTTPTQPLHDLLSVLALASQCNAKINSILDRQDGGQTLTPLEVGYLKRVSTVDLAIKPNIENTPLLVTRQMPLPSVVETIVPSGESKNATNITQPVSHFPESSSDEFDLDGSGVTTNSPDSFLNTPELPLATPY